MSNKSDSEITIDSVQTEQETILHDTHQGNGKLNTDDPLKDEAHQDFAQPDDKTLAQTLEILGIGGSKYLPRSSPPTSRRGSLTSIKSPPPPHSSSQDSNNPPASPRGSQRSNGQPSSPRGSLRASSPPSSPRGSVRGVNSVTTGSGRYQRHKRGLSRPSLLGFFTETPTTSDLAKEEKEHEKQKKLEEIKQKVYARRAERQEEEKKASQQPRHVELLLHGIEENSAGKNTRIITDNSISVVFSTINQLTPIEKPELGVITRLDLQKNKIGGRGAYQLCEFLLTRPSVEILDVSNNAQLFCEVPQNGSNIRNSSGLVGAEGYVGANAFKQLLIDHPGLAYLMINKCGLNDFGANIIVTGLKENSSLVFLDLSNNDITDTGAISICRAFTSHKTITTILLDGNNLTDACSKQLLSLVQKNTRITTLEINDSKISKPQMDEIKAQVNKNREEYASVKAAQQQAESHEQSGEVERKSSLGDSKKSNLSI